MLWIISPVTYFGAVWTFLGAERLECVELAPTFSRPTANDSASKLDALQALRVAGMPVLPCVTVFTAAHTKWQARLTAGDKASDSVRRARNRSGGTGPMEAPVFGWITGWPAKAGERAP